MENREEYLKVEKKFIKEHNITVGTKLRVLAKAKAGENGWDNGWGGKRMSKTIGNVGEVTRISNTGSGIQLYINNDSWWYPYFVLEPLYKNLYEIY